MMKITEAGLVEDEIGAEVLVEPKIVLGVLKQGVLLELADVRAPIGLEGFFAETRGVDRLDQVAIEKGTDAVNVNGAVATEEERIGFEIRELGPVFMDFDDVGLPLLEDVGINGRGACAGEEGITEQTEIDDLYAMGEEHDGAHVGAGVDEMRVMRRRFDIGQHGGHGFEPGDSGPGHVDGRLPRLQLLNVDGHPEKSEGA